MQFLKYHALGNDYLVLPISENVKELLGEQIQTICHRHFGIGSDGILLETHPTQGGDFALRIFNPDGSEAEKSGNGLRIFCRYLHDNQMVKNEPFIIETISGKVRCQILCPEKDIIVEMGKAEFLREGVLEIQGSHYPYFAVSMGNPHCVIAHDNPSEELIKKIGPEIECHAYFINRTNVQLMKVLDENRIQIEIWERGAGYTLASGSSACAAAAVFCRISRYQWRDIVVEMAGGQLKIDIDSNNLVTMRGQTTFVGEFYLNQKIIKGTSFLEKISL